MNWSLALVVFVIGWCVFVYEMASSKSKARRVTKKLEDLKTRLNGECLESATTAAAVDAAEKLPIVNVSTGLWLQSSDLGDDVVEKMALLLRDDGTFVFTVSGHHENETVFTESAAGVYQVKGGALSMVIERGAQGIFNQTPARLIVKSADNNQLKGDRNTLSEAEC